MFRALCIGVFTGTAALTLLGCAAEQPETSRPESGNATGNAGADVGGDAERDVAGSPNLRLTGRVVDAAGILSEEFEAELTGMLEEFETGSGVQLVVVTAPDLGGKDIAIFARDLGNDWGIGDEARDDGLLVLIAPNERQCRIAVGYGLEEIVTDAEAQNIIDNDMLPRFAQGDFEAGTDAGARSLIREVDSENLRADPLKDAA